MTSVRLTATEHLHESGRWDRCAQLFFTTQTTLVLTKNTHFRPSHTLVPISGLWSLHDVWDEVVSRQKAIMQHETRKGTLHIKLMNLLSIILNLMIDYWNVESYLPKQILKKAHVKVIAAQEKHHWEHLSWETSSNLSCQTMYVHSAESEASNVHVLMMNQQLI
jgi:hypothetical protein